MATTRGLASRSVGVELVPADIDGVDFGRPAGEQHLGEAPGRGADIERHPSFGVEAEGIERGCELEAAARDDRRRPRGPTVELGVGGDQRCPASAP